MPASELDRLVAEIRRELNLTTEVPGFDPANGNEHARFLFLLEAPGPRAVRTGMVSFDNPDPSARNLKFQLEEAGIDRRDIVVWNVVPWYLGKADGTAIRPATRIDVLSGLRFLPPLLAALPRLECIVLVGAAARQAHISLSAITTARVLSCHHTSARVQNINPNRAQENVAVFRMLLAGSNRSDEPLRAMALRGG